MSDTRRSDQAVAATTVGECDEPDCACHQLAKSKVYAASHQPAARGGGGWAVDPYSSCEVVELDYAPPHLADRIAQTYGNSKEQRAQRAAQIVTEHNQHQALVAERERLRAAIEVAVHNLNAGNDPKFLAEYLRLTLNQNRRSE